MIEIVAAIMNIFWIGTVAAVIVYEIGALIRWIRRPRA